MAENEKTNEQPTTPTPTPAVNGADSSGQPEQDASKAVIERIKRAKAKEREAILKELGYEDLETAKAHMAEVKQVKEGQLSEAQKLQKQIEKLTNDLTTATTRAAKAEADRRADLIHAAIKDAANDGPSKAEHVTDVITFIRDSGADLAELVDDEGKVDAKEVKKLVDNVRKERPTWFKGGGPGSPSNANGKTVNPDEQDKKARQGKKLFSI